MAVTQYIGSRYVPLFAEPLAWDITKTYEPLTIVYHQGNSYTSKQAVPAGIDLTNESYWAITGNYNAQIEQYRQEVRTYDNRITANATAISTEETARETADQNLASDIADNMSAISAETTARSDADTTLQTNITNEATTRANADTALGSRIDAEETARIAADNTLDGKIDAEESARIAADDVLEGEYDNLLIEVNGIKAHTASVRSIYTGTNCLIFGDSFSDARVAYSENGYWPNEIRDAFGFTIFNYAVSGSGFVQGSANLSTEIIRAIREMTESEKNNTSIIIVYYGYNDLSNNISDASIMSAYNDFLQRAVSAYPNARILMIPFNYGSGLLTMARENKITGLITQMRASAAGYPVEIIDNSRFWLLGQFQWFKDSVHPNIAGYKQITSFITNAILGSDTRVIRSGSVALEAGVESYRACNWIQNDGLVNIYARFVPSEATSTATTTTLVSGDNIPPIMLPELLVQTPVSGVNATGVFTISHVGLRAYQYTVPNATTALILNTTIRASASKTYS